VEEFTGAFTGLWPIRGTRSLTASEKLHVTCQSILVTLYRYFSKKVRGLNLTAQYKDLFFLTTNMAEDERPTGTSVILVDAHRAESFTLSSGLKKLSRRLKAVFDVQRRAPAKFRLSRCAAPLIHVQAILCVHPPHFVSLSYSATRRSSP
jgi:hypothetical protein